MTTNLKNYTDVIVIGAGVCGLVTAQSLMHISEKSIRVIDRVDKPASPM